MKTSKWTYERTHPWLAFTADLTKAPVSLWMLLGEARSKLEHIAGVPLRPNVASELHKIFLAKGVHATTAIEGNTLTEAEIRKHMDGQLRLPLSQAYLQQEAENIIHACVGIAEELLQGHSPELTVGRIRKFNSIVLNKVPSDSNETPGEIRMSSVGVGNYLGPPAGECEHLVTRLCEWLNGPVFNASGDNQIIMAILKAILAHLYIAWIHPFGDGNGRTARLVEFQVLVAAGVPSPAAHLLSNHYNKTRSEYYRQLDAASKSGGNVIPFLEYAVAGLVDGLVEQLGIIRDFQWQITWRNYVHEKFGEADKMSASELRQHHLALDLGDVGVIVPLDKIMTLNARIAQAYARKSAKTLRRDINKLKEWGMIEETAQGIRARRELILAFLPQRCPNQPPGAAPSPEKD